jgi:prepilin-type N-terminal cleavage/methylation domain-containing protein
MNARGFSLIETLVAVSITAVVLSTLAHLLIVSARANADARRATFASVLAAQKLEQLRAPGVDLTPQPGDSLSRNMDGRCDFLDEYGRALGGGTTPPAGTVYLRRWSVAPAPDDPANTVVLQVAVAPRFSRGSVDATGSGDQRLFGGAHLVSVKTRRAP